MINNSYSFYTLVILVYVPGVAGFYNLTVDVGKHDFFGSESWIKEGNCQVVQDALTKLKLDLSYSRSYVWWFIFLFYVWMFAAACCPELSMYVDKRRYHKNGRGSTEEQVPYHHP